MAGSASDVHDGALIASTMQQDILQQLAALTTSVNETSTHLSQIANLLELADQLSEQSLQANTGTVVATPVPRKLPRHCQAVPASPSARLIKAHICSSIQDCNSASLPQECRRMRLRLRTGLPAFLESVS